MFLYKKDFLVNKKPYSKNG